MKTEVMELVKELGFEIVSTSAVYGVEDARVHARKDGLTILTKVSNVSGMHLSVNVMSDDRGDCSYDATFHFYEGELPDLRFREYTPELIEIARRFGEVAGFEI